MKDIPVEEMVAISPEIHEAALRVGCTHVSITGRIWPGGLMNGAPEGAARFTEFSWYKAAIINGRAIFEEADLKAYAELLNAYGLGEELYPEPAPQGSEIKAAPVADPPAASSENIELAVRVLPATSQELERQAAAEGISVGALLDWKFQPRSDRSAGAGECG